MVSALTTCAPRCGPAWWCSRPGRWGRACRRSRGTPPMRCAPHPGPDYAPRRPSVRVVEHAHAFVRVPPQEPQSAAPNRPGSRQSRPEAQSRVGLRSARLNRHDHGGCGVVTDNARARWKTCIKPEGVRGLTCRGASNAATPCQGAVQGGGRASIAGSPHPSRGRRAWPTHSHLIWRRHSRITAAESALRSASGHVAEVGDGRG